MHVRGFTRHPSSGVTEKKARHLRRSDREDSLSEELGITAVELMPVFQFDPQDCSAGASQLLGLCASFILCAAPGLQLASGSARASGRVSRYGQSAAPRGNRSHSRRCIQPHCRRQSRRTDPEFSRHRQPHLLILEPDRSRYANYSGTGNTLNAQSSHRPPDDPGQPSLLGQRDACGWFPIRSGSDPGAR